MRQGILILTIIIYELLSLSVHFPSQFQFKFDISFLIGEELNKFAIAMQIFFY